MVRANSERAELRGRFRGSTVAKPMGEIFIPSVRLTVEGQRLVLSTTRVSPSQRPTASPSQDWIAAGWWAVSRRRTILRSLYFSESSRT